MAEAYPGGAHAALASRRSSFRNSLRRLRPTEKPDTSFMRGVWKYEIFPSYVRVTNKQVLQLDAQCQELPPCPSVGQILSFKLPSFSFNTTTYGSRYFTVAFLFFGAEDNEVFLKPFFVMHSDQDIVLSVLNPRSLFIEKAITCISSLGGTTASCSGWRGNSVQASFRVTRPGSMLRKQPSRAVGGPGSSRTSQTQPSSALSTCMSIHLYVQVHGPGGCVS